jgi:hypothetical protein
MSDNGKLNERILVRAAKRDYLARVEAPRKRVPTMLTSPEAKRLFARFFDSMQLHTNFVSNIARSRLRNEEVEQVEAMIEQTIDKGLGEIDKALDDAEALCKANHISEFAEYDQDPLNNKVGVISSLSRKYLDLIVRFDQLMPMLATLEIDSVIKKKDLDTRVAGYKKVVKRVAYSARELASGLRKRMNQLAEDEKGSTLAKAKGFDTGETQQAKSGNGYTHRSGSDIASQSGEEKDERERGVTESRDGLVPVASSPVVLTNMSEPPLSPPENVVG